MLICCPPSNFSTIADLCYRLIRPLHKLPAMVAHDLVLIALLILYKNFSLGGSFDEIFYT